MEFFRIVDIDTSEKEICDKISFDRISEINPEIVLLDGNSEIFRIGCIWGEFTLQRYKIKGGLRFSMTDCPNALAWTVTTGFPPEREKIVIHLTINRTQKPREFIEEIDEFLDSWVAGLIQNYKQV